MSAENAATQTTELGKISWNRNYEEALKLSTAKGKPIFLY